MQIKVSKKRVCMDYTMIVCSSLYTSAHRSAGHHGKNPGKLYQIKLFCKYFSLYFLFLDYLTIGLPGLILFFLFYFPSLSLVLFSGRFPPL